MITHDRINSYFGAVVPLPDATVFSEKGFAVLAEWSERQPWWAEFAGAYLLGPDWRSSCMGDSHLFAVNLFAFLNQRSR